MAKAKSNRKNIHFRQTAKSFKSQKQTKIFSKINRNVAYDIYNKSRKFISQKFQKAKIKYPIKSARGFVRKLSKAEKKYGKNKRS